MRAFVMTAFILISMLSCFIGAAHAEKKILINAAARTLSLYDGDVRICLYPVGLGKVSTPTPTGYYKIRTKEIDPPWIDPSNPEYEIPSGSNNPLGYRWMQIQGNYGIHGTNKPDSIGFYVSNGCIRMKEADVEALFDMVEIDTPVEITYNRLVIEKAADGNVVYYIYPDGYRQQPLDVKYVNSWLIPWGVSAFADDREIEQAIYKSAGEPIYIGKPYTLELSGETVPATEQNKRHFDNKAVERGGITYLPAVPIAIAMQIKLEWRHHATLATKFGEVPGIERKGQLYINEDDAGILFGVEGWKEGNIYKLKPLPPKVEEPPIENQGDQGEVESPIQQADESTAAETETEIQDEKNVKETPTNGNDDTSDTKSNTKKKGDKQ